MPDRYRVDLSYRLVGPFGRSPDTHHKTWFFDLPAPRWDELLPRIFYDANVAMRRQEPHDESWLALDDYDGRPVPVGAMLAWDGEATSAKAAAHLPWILSSCAVTWEFTSCYLVDETGAYDGMTGNDFSELMLYRALEEGRATGAQAREFLAKLYPGNPSVYAERQQRLANLVTVRATTDFRRPPGSTSFVSGPVREFTWPARR
jgi:hypothetical protein